MRTLSDNLLAEQKKTSYIPYVKVNLPDWGDGVDISAYWKEILTADQDFGSTCSILAGDLWSWYFSGGATVDLRGYRVDISWGAEISASPDVSQQAPLFIKDHWLVDMEGEVALQIELFDCWQLLQMLPVMNASPATAPPAWAGDTTIYDIFSSLLTGTGIALIKDSTDGIIDSDSHMPYYECHVGTRIATVIAELKTLTNCYCIMKSDGMHVGKLPETSANSYTFDISTPGHQWKTNTVEDELVVPNRIIFVDVAPRDAVGDDAGASPTYEGSAEDTNSITLMQRINAGNGNFTGYVTRVYEDENLNSNSWATQWSEAVLGAHKRATSGGLLTAPMECSIELGDIVQVLTSRWP